MSLNNIRVGLGFDIHRWSEDPDRKLVLGGVVFDDVPGLVGHSDADVVIHACIDALLGAAGLGDIGQQFPNSDESLKGASSLEFLVKTVELLVDAGWSVINLDCCVITDKPKISEHKSEMINNISSIVSAPVNIKGKTTEGSIQFADSISCHSVALLGAK